MGERSSHLHNLVGEESGLVMQNSTPTLRCSIHANWQRGVLPKHEYYLQLFRFLLKRYYPKEVDRTRTSETFVYHPPVGHDGINTVYKYSRRPYSIII